MCVRSFFGLGNSRIIEPLRYPTVGKPLSLIAASKCGKIEPAITAFTLRARQQTNQISFAVPSESGSINAIRTFTECVFFALRIPMKSSANPCVIDQRWCACRAVLRPCTTGLRKKTTPVKAPCAVALPCPAINLYNVEILVRARLHHTRISLN